MSRRGRLRLGAVLAAAGLAVATPAAAVTLTVPGCRAMLAGQWSIAGDTATAPDQRVRLREAPEPQVFIGMSLADGFQQIDQTAVLVVLGRDLPDQGRQFRGITRASPSCAVDVIARTAAAATSGEAIARSVTNIPRPQ